MHRSFSVNLLVDEQLQAIVGDTMPPDGGIPCDGHLEDGQSEEIMFRNDG